MNDALPAYAWRNAPNTREYSRDPADIPLESHLAWWSKALDDPTRRLLIACFGDTSVGAFRLDLSGSDAEVSVYVDPDLKGLGLGSALIRAGQEWARQHEPQVVRLLAEVHSDNSRSEAAFKAAGFRRKEANRWVWDKHG